MASTDVLRVTYRPDPTPEPPAESWWLLVLVLAEAAFALVEIGFGHATVQHALVLAANASGLGLVAVYARAAVLQVGRKLRMRVPPPVHGRGVTLRIAAWIGVELAIVAVAGLVVGVGDGDALRLAAGVTVMCLAICHGPGAWNALGRRMFPEDGDGR